jgi:hypothetical protein
VSELRLGLVGRSAMNGWRSRRGVGRLMRVLVLSSAIIIAGFLSGGVYQITGSGTVGGTAVLNRFTGSGGVAIRRLAHRRDIVPRTERP